MRGRPKGSKNKAFIPNPLEVLGTSAVLTVFSDRMVAFKFLIDIEDVEEVQKARWGLKPAHTKGKFYAVSTKGVPLHRLVTKGKWDMVDHIDRDTTDNRKRNLRESSKSFNNANGLSRYRDLPRGVYRTPEGRFYTKLIFEGKYINLGRFDSPGEAHEVYKLKHIELFKKHSIFTKKEKL